MKFTGFKEFRPLITTDEKLTLKAIVKYLAAEMIFSFRELTLGLTRLNFEDNFDSFETTVTIAAGAEETIVNELDTIPTQRIIVRSDDGGRGIADGPTDWTQNFLYLKNYGGTDGTVTVVFLK